MTAHDRAERSERCPDGGYCHGSTAAIGSTLCEPGACYRVRHAGPLSGVFPGDRWPDSVRPQAEPVNRAAGVSTQPTDAEREMAAQCVSGPGTVIERIAQALADQRAKYEAVADELDAESQRMNPTSLSAAARAVAAERIRSVAR